MKPVVAEQLAKLIKEKGGNVAAVARKLGISRQRLGQYVRGEQTPKIDFWLNWKKVFNEDPLQLVINELKESLPALPAGQTSLPQSTSITEAKELLEKSGYIVMLKTVYDQENRLKDQVIESNTLLIEMLKQRREREGLPLSKVQRKKANHG